MMTGPKPGDLVRGWVEGTFLDDGCIMVDNCHVPLRILHDVDFLPPPELEWRADDVALDAKDQPFVRTQSGDWFCLRSRTGWRSDVDMHRPLRRARIVLDDGAS